LVRRSICSLAFDKFYSNFENGRIPRQVPLKEKYCQKVALKKAPTYEDTTFSGLEQASRGDFYRSAGSPETLESFKKTIESKERLQTTVESRKQQSLNARKNAKERLPTLITKQWVRQEIIWKVHRDIKEDDALLHETSAAKCQTDTGGKQEKEDISKLDLVEHRMEESEWHPRQAKALECNLRVHKENYERTEEEHCSSKVCPVSYFNHNVISCKSTKENANGLKEANTSILVFDRSTVSGEQCYQRTVANSPAATATPAEQCPVSTPLEAGGAPVSKFPLPEHLDTVGIVPACVATTPNCANAARVVEEKTSQTELFNSHHRDLFRDKHNKEAEVTRSDHHQSQGTLDVKDTKMEQPRKFNASNYAEIQNESQKRVEAKNFWSKHRVNYGKCLIRFRFMSLRSVLRNNKMPHM